MSSTLYRLGLSAARSPWKVLGTWFAIILLAAAGALTLGKGLDDAFSIPGTESQEGLDSLATRFPQLGGTGGQIIFVSEDDSPITAHEDQIIKAMDRAREVEGVETATNPFDKDMPGEKSEDGTAIIANIQLDPELDVVPKETLNGLTDIVDDTTHTSNGLHAYIGGQVTMTPEMGMSIMEVLGVIAALIVLSIVFRAVRSAFIPIVTAITGIIVSMIVMFMGTSIFTISSATPTLALMLGLAVGIDYSLFIVSRHLDQLRSGLDPYESIARATATSGSAVIFAGLTVVIALVGLFITGIPFITVMGVVSAVAVACNVLAALTLLPAILGLFGEKIRPKRQRQRTAQQASDPSTRAARTPLLERWVRAAIRFPLVTIIVVTVGLGAVAIPFKDLELALPDQGTEDPGSYGREAYDIVAEKFGAGHNATIMLTADIINTKDPLGVMDELERDVLAIDGVDSVQIATPNMGADMGVVVLRPTEGPTSELTKNVVDTLRTDAPQWEKDLGISDIKVTGATAVAIDIADRLDKALLPFTIFVVGLSLVLLAMVFRSIWVPLKAAVGFLLSAGAAFGVTSMVFTYGWGADLLQAKATGPVIPFLPIMTLGVLFGLAMDYEVFLVTRMREEYMHTRDPRQAIIKGFTASAPVVIAAAAIMIFIFAGFIPGSKYMIQPIALSLAVGVFVDAFVVRMTLVPAVLALLGDGAWRFPAVLDRLLPHLDVEGEGLGIALEHREWTAANGASALRLRDVEIPRVSGRGTLGPLSGALAPGSITLLASEDADARASVLALFSARLEPSTGTLFVHDRQVPGETGAAQAHVELYPEGRGGTCGQALVRERDTRIVVIESLSDLLEAGDTALDRLELLASHGTTIVIGVDALTEGFAERLRDPARVEVLPLAHLVTDHTDPLPLHTDAEAYA
ncbi:MMPL family transporter [Dermabacter sp. Marseille-Q3180]|uniref:MMPL family transporter n=1 Tax=Dermabacter sp. Marseille-Q3180 TaxID=2758090 RepID=UPI002024D3FC|nr:MMPL family transporter [Dermabacter sp. Marseille-Q3180]